MVRDILGLKRCIAKQGLILHWTTGQWPVILFLKNATCRPVNSGPKKSDCLIEPKHTVRSVTLTLKAHATFHFWEGKAIFIFHRALPFENLKVDENFFKGHQGQDQRQQDHGLSGLELCNSRSTVIHRRNSNGFRKVKSPMNIMGNIICTIALRDLLGLKSTHSWPTFQNSLICSWTQFPNNFRPRQYYPSSIFYAATRTWKSIKLGRALRSDIFRNTTSQNE